MSSLIKALNPTAPINGEAEAVAAARASAIAIAIGVLWGAVGLYYSLSMDPEVMKSAMIAQSPQAAEMADMMYQIVIGGGVAVVVIQVILGLVQWFKPNIVIPIIFVILVAYGLFSTAAGLAMVGSMDIPEAARAPAWLTYGGLVVLVVELLLHISGIRGASALSKLRRN